MMGDEEYPPADVRHLVRRVPDADVSAVRRDWTGNDESARNHHGAVPLRAVPISAGGENQAAHNNVMHPTPFSVPLMIVVWGAGDARRYAASPHGVNSRADIVLKFWKFT
jgi:hypothetical protein